MATSYDSRLGTSPEEAVKAPCVGVSLTNITLSGEQTIGSVAVVAGNRWLVGGQTDSTENGIYDVSASAWTRAKDWNDAQDVVNGQLMSIPNAVYQATFTGAFNPGSTSVSITDATGFATNNTTHHELGSDAATSSHPSIITGHIIRTNYFDSNRTSGSGGDHLFTGVTTAGKAGNWPNTTDGTFYDADGKQFSIKGVANVLAFGAVGNGVADDTLAFGAALAVSNRDVYVPPATFLLTSLYIAGLSSCKLTGVPGASVIKKKAGSYGVNVDGAISGIIDFVGCSGITLEGLKIDGNDANATPSGGTHLNGINFYNCNNIRTENCEFVDIEFIGLNHQISYDVFVTNNKFLLCGWCGSNFSGGYFTTYGAERCVISGNTYKSTWAGVVAQISTQYLTVTNNIFVNSSLIYAQDVRNSTISGNTFDGAAPAGALGEQPQDAITIESDDNITITGNTINAAARHGIYVVGNFIENGPQEGVLTCDNVAITGNTITNCVGEGINFTAGSAFTYNMTTHTASAAAEADYTYSYRGVIKGNIISGCTGRGIIIGITDDVVVAGNIVSFNGSAGITLGSSKHTMIHGNSVSNNSQTTADAQDGIQIATDPDVITDVTISSNIVFDDQASRTQRYGINNPNSDAEVKSLNNIVTGNGTNYSSVTVTLPYDIISPSLLNGAASFGSGFKVPSYYIDNDGIVHLQGLITLGSSGVGAALFTLPVGLRPATTEMFVVIANGVLGRCDITSNGNVTATSGANSNYYSISGISFAANR